MTSAADLAKHVGGFFTVAEAADLPADNVFTVVKAGLKEVGQGSKAEEKPVLEFLETKKALVLNKGRCKDLATLFGDDDLKGKRIRLFTEGGDPISIISPE